MRPAISVVGLALVVLATLLITLRTLHSSPFHSDRSAPASTHIVLCSDTSELRPLYIVIKSTLTYAAHPAALQFHVVTSPQLETIYNEVLRKLLPEVQLEVHTNPSYLRKIRKHVTYRTSSQVERQMANIFRFVPFFLPEFLGRISYGGLPPRLVYLDTDVIMLGDVGKLVELNLRGHALAAARSCETRMHDIVDFSLVKSFGDLVTVNGEECLLSRAVMVIDPVKWQFQNISGKLLRWLERYRQQPLLEDLWVQSLDVVPLMLSVNGFLELLHPWTCVNLGKEELSPASTKNLLDSGFTHEDLHKMARTMSEFGALRPPVHRCTARAELLHFGGPLKPWLDNEFAQALCVQPKGNAPLRGWSRASQGFTCKVKGRTVQLLNCSLLWWDFLNEEEDCMLRGYEEWPTQLSTASTTSTSIAEGAPQTTTEGTS